MEDIDFSVKDVVLAHEYIFPPGFSYENYKDGRRCHGLVYIVSGRAEYNTGKNIFAAKSGNILFLPALAAYTVANPSNENFHHYTINFTMADSDSAGTIFGKDEATVLETKSGSSYAMLFEQASYFWRGKKQGYKIICKAYLYEILYNFFNEYIPEQTDLNDLERIFPAKNYIDEFYTRDISMQNLAEMCGISETSLRRIFKKLYNLSPINYQIKLRMLKAKDLLSCKIYSVKEVAFKTGFNDPYYFSKYFKKYTGLTPYEYKRLY